MVTKVEIIRAIKESTSVFICANAPCWLVGWETKDAIRQTEVVAMKKHTLDDLSELLKTSDERHIFVVYDNRSTIDFGVPRDTTFPGIRMNVIEIPEWGGKWIEECAGEPITNRFLTTDEVVENVNRFW